MRYALALFVFLCSCATAPEPEPAPEPAPPPPVSQKQETIAVAGLMESARADVAAGRLATAAASLERALRIEPRNPRLWHDLAQVRLRQGQFAQAASLAQRSNAWVGGDTALREANDRVIEQARAGR
jgi:Tfp pilus assembly protein PilF